MLGAVNVTAGTLMATNSFALGFSGGIGATVSDGATLAMQGGISVPAPIALNGAGAGNGALWSLQGQNSLTGPITLGDDSQIERGCWHAHGVWRQSAAARR